jgi:hypothetical protein
MSFLKSAMISSERLPAKGTVILENNNGRWKQYSGGHYCFRSFLKSAMISSERLPAKGTKARVSVSLSTNALLWPFLHMLQRRTHSNPHSLCFFGCGGAKYPHTQTQTHAVFLGVKEENILTPKLKLMLQRRTGSHAVFLGVKEENIFTCSRGAQAQTHAPGAHGLSR